MARRILPIGALINDDVRSNTSPSRLLGAPTVSELKIQAWARAQLRDGEEVPLPAAAVRSALLLLAAARDRSVATRLSGPAVLTAMILTAPLLWPLGRFAVFTAGIRLLPWPLW